jgi:hypothetical protein
MADMTRARSAACLVTLLAACTAPHWEKAGTSADQAQSDLKLCQAQAPVAPRPAPGPRAKPASSTIDFASASDRSIERMRADDEHVAACMRKKGYVSVK